METKKEVATVPKNGIAQKLNENVFNVLSQDGLAGFEKAFLIANATSELKKLLTPEYMRPIMELQGNRMGFKTDKDKNKDGTPGPGYPEHVVKNCLIEAVLMGVQPFGNQFNIIAENSYITKEGYQYLLKNIRGLEYDITFELPRINAEKTSAAIIAIISWQMSGEKKEKKIDIPVKMNAYMGSDAVIGKATRKSRKWLYETITGIETSDASVEDVDNVVVSSKTNKSVDKEKERLILMVNDCKTIDDLELLRSACPDVDNEIYEARKAEIKKAK